MTPLIEITSLGFANNNRVFAKCENANKISHSHYDRVYRHLFDNLPDKVFSNRSKYHLLESSSGNAGTAFAKFCQLYGFNGTIVFPKEVRQARIKSIQSSIVKVKVSSYDGYMLGARKSLLKEVSKIRKQNIEPIIVNHSQTWQSVKAMRPCGYEIIQQLTDINRSPDVFVSALGNGTSTSGIGIPLKEVYKDKIKIIGFEPKCASSYSDSISGNESIYKTSNITGTGVWGINFPNYVPGLIDDVELIDENIQIQQEWEKTMNQVLQQFDISIGLSSAVAIEVAKTISQKVSDQNIVIIFYDIREFY